MGRCRGTFACCFAVLLLAGCNSAGGGASEKVVNGRGGANPSEPIQRLLQERARRLLAGDIAGYLAGLGPQARGFEEPIARVALSLPFEKIDMTVNEATISDDGTKFRGASVHLIYKFKELPEDNPFRVRFLYDIDRQQDGSWVVVRSVFDRRQGIPPPPPLWPTGPVEITRSPHFLVMNRPGVPKVAEATALAEKGYTQLLPRLPLVTDPRALLVLAKDDDEFVASSGTRGGVAQQQSECIPVPATALCRPEERLVLADLPATLGVAGATGETTASPEGVFQHELAHLALSRFTRSCTNRWVVEGGAMLLAGERRVSEWRALLPKLDSTGLNPLSYGFANAAVSYLVESFGAAKFFDFYQNFKSLPEQECSGNVANVRSRLDERLLRSYYRFGVEDLEGFTRDYIRKALAAAPSTP